MIRFLKDFLFSIIINVVILLFLSYLKFGIYISYSRDTTVEVFQVLFFLGFLFRVVNFVIKKILYVVSFPLRFLTMGLFSILINVMVLYLFEWAANYYIPALNVQITKDYPQAFILSVTISISYFLLSKLFK